MDDIAFVVINNVIRSIDVFYSYVIPKELVDKLKVGMRVHVPFGVSNAKREALVVKIIKDNIDRIKKSEKISRIKKIKDIIDDEPVIDEDMLDIAYKMKEEYICTYYEALTCILPTLCKNKMVKVAYLNREDEYILDLIESNSVKNIWQIKILQYLLKNRCDRVSDIIKFIGGGKSSINTLRKKGLIEYREENESQFIVNKEDIKKDYAKEPTLEQKIVLDKIIGYIKKDEYTKVLIHGVTGSGKTEVYMRLVEYCINNGKSAIVLVPEIALTPQMVDRFKARFGNNVAVIHSRLSKGERYEQWKLINCGKIKIVVGVRSAIFVPLKNIGIIIIDEEHEVSYKSETTPKYNAKDIAKLRCAKENAVLVYGSATPSIETYYEALTGEINLCTMKNRVNNQNLPCVELIDMRQELDDGNRSIFSYALRENILENIKNGQQTILFLNRRGHSNFMLCRSCGFVIKCIRCNVTMTYHRIEDRLICHYCGYTVKRVSECPKCKSNNIKGFGLGTQKVEEEIKKEFPEASVIRMDLDTTSYKDAHNDILKKFRDENINILIGTQMIAKGHDFPNVTLVGVLAADAMLNSVDFRAEERTFQLLTQVSGRAGRGEKKGKVVIQTYNVDAYSIQTAVTHDYKLYFDKEIKLRKELNYPPFSYIGVLTFSGEDDKEAFNWSKAVKKFIFNLNTKYKLNLDILGPNRAPISKIKNKYRWKLIIKGSNKIYILKTLTRVVDKFYNSKAKNVKLSVDINPVSMQ